MPASRPCFNNNARARAHQPQRKAEKSIWPPFQRSNDCMTRPRAAAPFRGSRNVNKVMQCGTLANIRGKVIQRWTSGH